jgi:hypothetical protein
MENEAPFWQRALGAVLGPCGIILIVALLAAPVGGGPIPWLFH